MEDLKLIGNDKEYIYNKILLSTDDISYFSGSNDRELNYQHLRNFYFNNYKIIHDFNRGLLKKHFDEVQYSFFIKLFDEKLEPTTFRISESFITQKISEKIALDRIKYIYCDLNSIDFVAADVNWPKVISKRIQARKLDNFIGHFWNNLRRFPNVESANESQDCTFISPITFNILTVENRLLTLEIIENTIEENPLKVVDIYSGIKLVLNDYVNFNPNIGVHYHQIVGEKKQGIIESISAFSFDRDATQHVLQFDDYYFSKSAFTVSIFTLIDVHESSVFLCQCVESKRYFVIESPIFIIYKLENQICNTHPDFERPLSINSKSLKRLIGMSFDLGSDMIYVDCLENIGKSMLVLKYILRTNS